MSVPVGMELPPNRRPMDGRCRRLVEPPVGGWVEEAEVEEVVEVVVEEEEVGVEEEEVDEEEEVEEEDGCSFANAGGAGALEVG